MGMITVRNVDDSLLQALEQRATAAGRTVEDEVRWILAQALDPAHDASRQAFIELMRQRRASYGDRIFPDSAEIIREMRDERSNEVGGL